MITVKPEITIISNNNYEEMLKKIETVKVIGTLQ